MKIYGIDYTNMLPTKKIEGRIGYYPVTNAKEWDELPKVYKAMEWFPIEISHKKTVAEYVVFDVVYATPYKIRCKVKVHVQEFQKIMFCLFKDTQFHLYSVSEVVFANGEHRMAHWRQDSISGAFEVCDQYGRTIGRQGGFCGFIPNEIERTEDGFKWKGFNNEGNRCHYQLTNPF